MRLSRISIKNFRCFQQIDVEIANDLCCVIGENNTGKSALIRAIQLCIDNNCPSVFRSLVREDIHASINVSQPNQVIIGIEFEDFAGKVNEEALVATWKVSTDRARVFYRFRPKPGVREKIKKGELGSGTLSLNDYSWEIRGGGDPSTDVLDMEWDTDGVGEAVRFSDLQSYLVLTLSALRDVESDLRHPRSSPLVRLIESCEIPPAEQASLIAILTAANEQIDKSPTIAAIAKAIDDGFKYVSGPAFEMDANLGLSAATFQSIVRNLKILLSDQALNSFEPNRNGLGMNNILYIAVLMEALRRRIASKTNAGQIVLIEEPEAHLHPQLQASLLFALNAYDAQVVLTTHSTSITSQASVDSMISLTRRADGSISSANLKAIPTIDEHDKADLERYLDATKSDLLFARKVILVEGAAEQFLIPALAKAVLGVDLDRLGISVIAIHGVHFDVYAKLFQVGGIEKKCAIIADADLKPSDADATFVLLAAAPQLAKLENAYVKIFAGKTTLERELVTSGTIDMLLKTVEHFGAPEILKFLTAAKAELSLPGLATARQVQLTNEMGDRVLNTAKRFGKARFAQVAARYAHLCTSMPSYISDALNWIRL